MKTYPEYKPSGIDWLGDIPENWEIVKLAWLASVQTGTTPSTTEDKYWTNANKDWFTPSDFDGLELKDSKRKVSQKAYDDIACRIFPPYTIYLVGIGATLGKIAFCRTEASANQQINAITFNKDIFPIYGAYYLTSINNVIKSASNAATLPILNQEQTKSLQIIVPPLSEQQKIADFLDAKTANIDALIGEKRAQVEELRAYRASLITETVTRGLNPDAPLRPSGIDWLGDIPEHWISTKAKYYIEIKSGDPISKDDINPQGSVPIFGGGEIIGFTIESNIPAQTIVIGRVGARCGCVRLTDVEAWATDNALVVSTTQNPQFLTRIFEAANLNRLNESNAQPLITATKIKDLGIPLPPHAEQQAIAEFLDEKTEKIDALISELEKQLEELAEYKKAVISEAVTGKVDVRDWKPQN